MKDEGTAFDISPFEWRDKKAPHHWLDLFSLLKKSSEFTIKNKQILKPELPK